MGAFHFYSEMPRAYVGYTFLTPFLLLDKEKESEFREEMRNINEEEEDCLRSLED